MNIEDVNWGPKNGGTWFVGGTWEVFPSVDGAVKIWTAADAQGDLDTLAVDDAELLAQCLLSTVTHLRSQATAESAR
jgi:hypothetical protein